MCTVTIVRSNQHRLRLGVSRDEQRSRPRALPPRVQRFGRRRAILPIDTAAGGTWTAVNDAGIAFAILNRNEPVIARVVGRQSRGLVIPFLLHVNSIAEALETAQRFELDQLAPFRLLVIDQEHLGRLEWNGVCAAAAVESVRPGTPLMFTSSGLGDDVVGPPRRRLFESMSLLNASQQDEFHRHSWPEHGAISVCMSRSDARTVSYSTVSLDDDEVGFTYHPDAPDQPAKRTILSLPTIAVDA